MNDIKVISTARPIDVARCNPRLSWRAKGLWFSIAGSVDDLTLPELCELSTDSDDCVKAALLELVDLNLITCVSL